jgi:hypothetical protein
MPKTEEKFLAPLVMLSGLVLVMVGLRCAADAWHLKLPWYLLHELVLLLVPMVWLMRRLYRELDGAQRLSFVVTSGLFISVSAVAELLAIEHRYWGFYTAVDPLSGFDVGRIPVEEFLSYPMLLNLPVLWYLWLGRLFPAQPPRASSPQLGRWLQRASVGAGLLALGLFVVAASGLAGSASASAVPLPDAAGAIRFEAGPRQFGWTIVELLGWAGIFRLGAWVAPQVHGRRLLVMTATYFPFALFFELIACGRGWWVWNGAQTLGVFAWVLPLESFSMYLTGALFPVLCFEALSRVFCGFPQTVSAEA